MASCLAAGPAPAMPSALLPRGEKVIKTFNGEIVEKDFRDKIKLKIEINQELSIDFLSQFNELKFVKINRIIID